MYKETMREYRAQIIKTIGLMRRERKRYKLNKIIENANNKLLMLVEYKGRQAIYITAIPSNSYNIPVRVVRTEP